MITIDALTDRNLIQEYASLEDASNWWVMAIIQFKRKPTLFRMIANHQGVALTDEPTSVAVTENLTWNGFHTSVPDMLRNLATESLLLKLYLCHSASEMIEHYLDMSDKATMPEPFQRKADL